MKKEKYSNFWSKREKMYRNNQKEPKRTHTKKLPDWVPEKKVTNPFLNLLFRKNERAIDNKKKKHRELVR